MLGHLLSLMCMDLFLSYTYSVMAQSYTTFEASLTWKRGVVKDSVAVRPILREDGTLVS